MIDAVKKFFANAFNFKGRATRSEYWWVMLAEFILYMIMMVFAIVTSVVVITNNVAYENLAVIIGTIIIVIPLIILIIPNWSLSFRRFHDAGFSGWFVLGNLFLGVLQLILSCIVLVKMNSMYYSWNYNSSIVILNIFNSIFSFISFGYSIFVFVVTLLPSKGNNKWGENPKFVQKAYETYDTQNQLQNNANSNQVNMQLNDNQTFCSQCGNVVDTNWEYCNYCGNKIK